MSGMRPRTSRGLLPKPGNKALCIRWTIGDVSPAGYEALRLSVIGARRLFGRGPIYAICVNTVSVAEVRERSGLNPGWIRWCPVTRRLPGFLAPHLGDGMSEGTGWKLIPPRLVPGADELALDNDVILWDLPEGIRRWLADGRRARILAADVVEGHGKFAPHCGPQPRNSGIRAIPADFDYEAAMAEMLTEAAVTLDSELDEQGLQIAALSRGTDPLVVTTDEVSICSPFPPHYYGLGACGAHFVGLNAREVPWSFCGRPAGDVRLEHWERQRPELYARLGLPLPEQAAVRRKAG